MNPLSPLMPCSHCLLLSNFVCLLLLMPTRMPLGNLSQMSAILISIIIKLLLVMQSQ